MPSTGRDRCAGSTSGERGRPLERTPSCTGLAAVLWHHGGFAMAVETIGADAIAEVKRLANEHFAAPEVQYLFTTPLTPARVGIWVAHQTRFVRNRRDCWALASGLAPL